MSPTLNLVICKITKLNGSFQWALGCVRPLSLSKRFLSSGPLDQPSHWMGPPTMLPIRYFGQMLGRVIRIDCSAETSERGRFARIAIVTDLSKPLISKVNVDDKMIFIEYEGLPTVCFHCGLYGHLEEVCRKKRIAGDGGRDKDASTSGVHLRPKVKIMVINQRPKQPQAAHSHELVRTLAMDMDQAQYEGPDAYVTRDRDGVQEGPSPEY
ncbi:hypothetical protein K1719_038722 [Acacia pycnantha]|nr:hypothetical protein K1719_038722 [Acacia pycnantha]